MINQVVEDDLRTIISFPLDWDRFSRKTVLISGANGFIPAYLVETLLYLNDKKRRQKTRVVGVVRNKEKAYARFADYIKRDDFQLVVQDICQPISLNEKIDYIIHAASQASPKYYGKDPVGTLSANILGTYNLLELARVNNVEGFLFFSSGEVYGEVNDKQIPIKEDSYGFVDPLDVRSCYAESKRMGENMCVSWYHQYAVPARIVRPFHTYGPGMDLQDGRVFADFVADIVNNRDILMKSDGSAVRAFCYLSDAICGFFTVLLKGINADAYNVGNDKGEISIASLADMLVKLYPEKGLKVIRSNAASQEGYIRSKISRNSPDISKANALGWRPNVSLQEGFARTIRSFINVHERT
jgi:nucleoside-diphosphate-sugar epimerase